MAKFTSTAPLNMRLPGGFEVIGAAGTTHRIPDSLIEEFLRDQAPFIPGLSWITQDETSAVNGFDPSLKYDKTGGTISGSVTATGALNVGGAATLSAALTAIGATNLSSTLGVTGLATLASVIASAMTATSSRTKGDPFFNVKAYGATGDGSTDDTTAFQAALTAAHPGGFVMIPAGTYKVSSTLSFPYQAAVLGSGASASFISWAGPSTGTVIQTAAYTTAEQKPYCQYEGFGIIGSTFSVAMDMKGLTHSRIGHIKIVGSSATNTIGIKVDGSYGSAIGAWWNTLHNLHIFSIGTGVLFTGVPSAGQANANTLRDSLIHGHSLYGVNVDVGDTVTVEAVDVTSTFGGTGMRTAGQTTRFRHCRVEQAAIGVLVASGADMVEIDSFHFSGQTTAVSISSGASKVRMQNNRFSGVTTEVSDSGTATLNSISRRNALVPFYFIKTDAASNVTNSNLIPAGLGSGTNTLYYPGRAFQIRAVSINLTNTISGGSITVNPTVGASVSTTLGATSSAAANATAAQGMGNDLGTSSNTLGCVYTTSAAFAPSGSIDILATVWIEFTD